MLRSDSCETRGKEYFGDRPGLYSILNNEYDHSLIIDPDFAATRHRIPSTDLPRAAHTLAAQQLTTFPNRNRSDKALAV